MRSYEGNQENISSWIDLRLRHGRSGRKDTWPQFHPRGISDRPELLSCSQLHTYIPNWCMRQPVTKPGTCDVCVYFNARSVHSLKLLYSYVTTWSCHVRDRVLHLGTSSWHVIPNHAMHSEAAHHLGQSLKDILYSMLYPPCYQFELSNTNIKLSCFYENDLTCLVKCPVKCPEKCPVKCRIYQLSIAIFNCAM